MGLTSISVVKDNKISIIGIIANTIETQKAPYVIRSIILNVLSYLLSNFSIALNITTTHKTQSQMMLIKNIENISTIT